MGERTNVEMAIKHNQKLLKNHFRKDWQRYVRVHFDQAGKKKSRRDKRVAKAAKLAPRPTDRLRPVVHCPTIKYNRRVRAGRGFSLAEFKANVERLLPNLCLLRLQRGWVARASSTRYSCH